jgi:hypothetical protein
MQEMRDMDEKPESPPTPPWREVVAKRTAALLGLPLTVLDTITILLLTAVADECFYHAPGGAGVGTVLVLGAGGCLASAWPLRKNVHVPLLVSLVLVAFVSAWNHYWLLSFVGWITLTAYAIRLHRPDWKISETVWAMPQTVMLAPVRLLGHGMRLTGQVSSPDADGEKETRHVPLRVVVAPLVATLLFVLIFIAANPVIEHLASRASEHLGRWFESIGEIFTVFRIFTWICWLLAFAALLRPAMSSQLADITARWHEALEPSGAPDPAAGNFAAAVSTLISVNLLFLAFNGLDSVYLYFRVSLPAGISYSEYSHRGCFWLTMALGLSTVVIGIIFRDHLNFHPRKKLIHVLSYVWAAQNGVLAIGALRRLQMYIAYNGLTRLRIVGIYGVLLVIVGLALMVWKVRNIKSFAWLVRRDMIALWVAVTVLALTPRDYICAKYNVAQAMTGNLRPLTLLHGQPLSPESFPPMIPLLDYRDDTGDTESLVCDGVAGLLGRQLLLLRTTRPTRWSEWQGSHAWALRRLEAVSDRLDTSRSGIGPAEEALRKHTRQWW